MTNLKMSRVLREMIHMLVEMFIELQGLKTLECILGMTKGSNVPMERAHLSKRLGKRQRREFFEQERKSGLN